MNARDYQRRADRTAIYPDKGHTGGLIYAALGLAGEAGEIANKVKKILRDRGGVVREGDRVEILAELGDVQWYVSALATELGGTLADDVMHENLKKLESRAERGVLQGSGDDR